MSWSQYITQKLINNVTKHGHKCTNICEAAFIGKRDDGTLYAASDKKFNMGEFKTTGEAAGRKINQAKVLLEVLGKGYPDPNIGCWVNGKKYQFVKVDKGHNEIVLKCEGGGAVVCFTRTLILVGVFNSKKKYIRDKVEKDQNVGDTTETLEELQEALAAY